jgi:uncharacterized protein (DUF427 family)
MIESVWDYPRPPRVEASTRRIRVVLGGETIVDTTAAYRVIETSHPPVFYVPLDEIADDVLSPSGGRTTVCEWKGTASYYDVSAGGREVERAAWTYHDPIEGFEAIRDAVAFYPGRMDACFVDDEQVTPQADDFYGGWITSEIVGPFKGDPGTTGL